MTTVAAPPERIGLTGHATIHKFTQADVAEAVAEGALRPRMDATRSAQLRALGPDGIVRTLKRGGLHVVDLVLGAVNLADMLAAGLTPYALTEAHGNLEVNGGINTMLNALIGTGALTLYTNANSRLCVGDGNGSVPTVAATDTTLAATTNRYNQVVAATYPSVSGQTGTWQSVFPTGQANFAWNEWGIDSGGGGGSGSGAASGLFNHKGVSLGTKTSASAWTFTATVTQS